MSISGQVVTSADVGSVDALIARMEKLDALIVKYAALIQAEAKRLARVKTGEMRDEIHTVLEAMAAEVISSTDHSAANEYGTARMAAHPFIRPAFERYAAAFLAEVAAIFT